MNKKGMLWDYPSHMLQNGWGWAFWNSKPLPFSDKCGYLNKFEFINCAMTKYSTHQDARQENLNKINYSIKKGVDVKEKDDDKNASILLAVFLKKNRIGQSFWIPKLV